MTTDPHPLTVVGIGADGWDGLADPARAALGAAEVVFGGDRQLALLPPAIAAQRVPWPSPLLPALPGLLDDHRGQTVCVLASGDPMWHGIGATLVRLAGPDAVRVLPHPSSISLAAARLGWPLADTDVLSLVSAPVEELHPLVHPGRRVLVLGRDGATPARVAALLTARGYGDSPLTVLSQLGGPTEHALTGTAASWAYPDTDPLNVIAVDCRGTGRPVPCVPGLPDELYDTDGQLTKREVRAVTLAVLGPQPGELLWDVGAGSGSIGIEWMRTHRRCQAVAVESSAERAARIRANAETLGVPGLRVVHGRAPDALAGLDAPDAVFIGGGLTRDGVLDTCLAALRGGGRLVANAVTVESEAVLAAWYARFGGELSRIAVSRGAPVGGFTGWRAMMPVTIWSVTKP
ncbi:precorrin-6y C5,15-methyltransferase (decarboxylating) subunit CbiE [Krasilnikovia sp. M28-CT-15]|uniref:precorrin-6y C5,15-methyltransferase (decarboxylating) subunit CbiE n=1 Tax=Krasilnikovia sp. M28-CT-15 TaxID=3373540 RepID=UPI00387631F4